MITSKDQLIAYSLEMLGSPVINVELSPSQQSTLADTAIDKFLKYHGEGSEVYYLAINVEEGVSSYVIPNEVLTILENVRNSTSISSKYINDTYGGYNRYQTTSYMFFDTISRVITAQHQELEEQLTSDVCFTFNEITHKLVLTSKPTSSKLMMFKVERKLDPSIYNEVYNNDWLKEYCVALFMIQWGVNLSKYDGVPLVGGAVLNGSTILENGKTEKERLLEELTEKYSSATLAIMR